MTESGEFPESWSSLRFPYMRGDLLDYLRQLFEPSHQDEWWRRPQTNPEFAFYTLDSTLKELIDMSGYNQDDFIEAAVGGELFDDAEANAIKCLCHTILGIIDSLRNAPDAAYLDHPEWPKVIREAGEAYQLMRDR